MNTCDEVQGRPLWRACAQIALWMTLQVAAPIASGQQATSEPEKFTRLPNQPCALAVFDEPTCRRRLGSRFYSDAVGPEEALPFDQYSNVCFTPITYCYLPNRYPVGSPCWCATPYGPSQGYVR